MTYNYIFRKFQKANCPNLSEDIRHMVGNAQRSPRSPGAVVGCK